MAYNKTPFKMMGKSPMMKALVGKQGNLPMHLQEKIKAANIIGKRYFCIICQIQVVVPFSPRKNVHYDIPDFRSQRYV